MMHAVLITFTSAAPKEALAEPFTDYARALCTIEGLRVKTWIADGDQLGGFHVFDSRTDADRYLASEMVAGLTANPAFSDFSINRYEVLDELSAITGTPTATLATRV